MAVIGGGPGGYTAAIKAAQAGLKTVCIDDRPRLGGVGVNCGCIPSKALLHYSSEYWDASTKLRNMGIDIGDSTVNWGKMQETKLNAVADCNSDIHESFDKLEVTYKNGKGSFVNEHEIKVTKNDGSEENIKADNIIIATGSKANELKNLPFDEKYICSSSGALEQEQIPKKIIVYGGGIVGIEIASVY